jgi:hypothetical protein
MEHSHIKCSICNLKWCPGYCQVFARNVLGAINIEASSIHKLRYDTKVWSTSNSGTAHKLTQVNASTIVPLRLSVAS